MIILAPGALDKVFSAETSRKASGPQDTDSRFSAWLKSPHQDTPVASNGSTGMATPYRNRLTRFE